MAYAPQLDNASLAPEHRGNDAVPEVSYYSTMGSFWQSKEQKVLPDNGPEILYNSILPEATTLHPSESNREASHHEKAPTRPRQQTVFWIAIAAVIFIASIGVGVGLDPKSHSRGPAANTASPSPNSTQSSHPRSVHFVAVFMGSELILSL